MRLSVTDKRALWRSVDAAWSAELSIVLRYASAVRLRDDRVEDAALKALLRESSLGEGVRIVPLLEYGGVEVSVLDETSLMATGTLKAVDGCLTASLLRSLAVGQVAFESGGNTGAALTAYGQRAGIETFFFCPRANLDLLDSRLFEARSAHLAAVEDRGFVKAATRRFCSRSGIRHAPEIELRYAASMFRGLFLLEQLLSGRRVDWLVQAVSAAFGPIGIYRVLRAFEGELGRIPSFLGVQQAANCPLVEAMGGGGARAGEPRPRLLSPVMYDDAPQTYDTFGEFRSLLSAAGGGVVAVAEEEFAARLADESEGGRLLEQLAAAGVGITVHGGEVVEKTGLMALVGTLGAIDRGLIPAGSRVLCSLTGGVSRADGRAVPEVILRGLDEVDRYAAAARREEARG